MTIPSSVPLDLIGLAYDTATDPAGWNTFLSALRDALRGSLATLLYHDTGGHGGSVSVATRVDPEGTRLYAEYFGALDPWALAASRQGIRPGAVNIGDTLISHADLRKTEYYSDFARRFEIVRCLGATLDVHGPFASTLSVMRNERAQPFGTEDRDLVLLLVPHLRRVLRIDQQIGELRAGRAAAEEALDRLHQPVVLLTPSGRPSFANAAARELLAHRDGVELGPRGLAASVPREARALGDAIRRAAAPSTGPDEPPWRVLTISRPSMRRAYVLTVVRLRGRELVRRNSAGSAVAVFIHDFDARVRVDETVLPLAYGLTRAEARLAADIASGLSVADSAVRSRVQPSTARWHLKNVFAKTGARGQADLVALVLGHLLAPGNPPRRPSSL
jgi:DNA-binding CsgD family transcriptional regulator